MKSEDKRLTKDAKKQTWLLIVAPLVAIILLGMFVGGAFWASQQMFQEQVVTETEVDSSDTSDVDDDENLEDKDVEDEEDLELEVVTGEHAVNVNWLTLQQQQKQAIHPAMFEVFYSEEMEGETIGEDMTLEPIVMNEWTTLNPVAYELGTVSGGAYDGYIVTHEIIELMGMGTFHQHYYLLSDPEGKVPPVVLDRYASNIHGLFVNSVSNQSARDVMGKTALELAEGKLRFDSGAIVAEFENAESVRDTQGREYNLLGVWQRFDFSEEFDYVDYPLTSKLENGRSLRLIGDEAWFQHQFFTMRKDGRVLLYDAQIPFWTNSDMIAKPVIIWSNGSYTRTEYMKGAYGGCGMTSAINVVERSEIGELKEIGSYKDDNSISRPVYGPIDLTAERYESDFAMWQRNNGLEEDPDALEQFAEIRPYFYWQDVYGRWIEFRNSEIAPIAECGKPVIYLYPEETMDITVELEPQGGFSITEPAYNDGWTVTATPDGQLTNHGDGEVYPYLFWEGWGAMYAEPDFYWVVARGDVESFLNEKLAELGFNDQEIADFMEFWYPRMQAAPYYKIGFHGTEVMDIIAPMELSEEPDTVIRVLMDYTELSEPIAENPPMLPLTPERHGFVVTEWGGVLR